jgi:hypothetical protein
VPKEVGPLGMDKVGGKDKTWLLELLAGEVEEEGSRNDDEDTASKEIVVDVENVVAKLKPASVKMAVGLG